MNLSVDSPVSGEILSSSFLPVLTVLFHENEVVVSNVSLNQHGSFSDT